MNQRKCTENVWQSNGQREDVIATQDAHLLRKLKKEDSSLVFTATLKHQGNLTKQI